MFQIKLPIRLSLIHYYLVLSFFQLSCSKENESDVKFQYTRNANIIWDKTINSYGSDIPMDLLTTKDGGSVISAYSSGGGGDKDETELGIASDYWIIKIDQSGEIIWQNTIGGAISEVLPHIIETEDGGFLVGGSSSSNISFDKTENSRGLHDYWLVKLNSFGEIEWDKTFGGQNQDYIYSILETPDGYLIGGISESSESGDKNEASRGGIDIWLIKINKLGSLIWQKTYGGASDDTISSIIRTIDGGYLIAANSKSGVSVDKSEPSYGDVDAWIFKINPEGQILWDKTIGSNLIDTVIELIQLSDGRIIAAGTSPSKISGNKTVSGKGERDVWIVGMDSEGGITWQKSYGGDKDDILYDIINTGQHLFITASSRSGISGDKSTENYVWFDTWLLKLDLEGELLDETTLRATGVDRPQATVSTIDGNLLTLIVSSSGKSPDKSEDNITSFESIWLVKLTTDWD